MVAVWKEAADDCRSGGNPYDPTDEVVKAEELNHPIETIEPVGRMMISLPRLIEDLHQMARDRERLDWMLVKIDCDLDTREDIDVAMKENP